MQKTLTMELVAATAYRHSLDVVNDWTQQLPDALRDDLERFGYLGSLTHAVHGAVTKTAQISTNF